MAYGLPDFSSFLSAPTAPPPPAAPVDPGQPSGTGNALTSGLQSGFYNTLSQAGGFGEAVARAVGADSLADKAAAYAAQEKQTANTYANPQYENAPWYSPGGLTYRLAQMAPGAVGALAGGVAGAALAPEEGAAAAATGFGGFLARHAAGVGASLASLPQVVGSNVEASKDYYGDLDQGRAIKALALGVPEAALQGVLPAKLEAKLAGDVGGSFLGGVKNAAITQAAVAPATEFLTQMMGDPNRPMGDRAQDLIDSALQGGVLGGLSAGVIHPVSAAIHAIAKTPVANVTPGSLMDVLNKALNPVEPSAPIQTPAQFDVTPQPEGPVFGRRQNLTPAIPGLDDLPFQQAPGVPTGAGLPQQFDFGDGGPTAAPQQGELNLQGGRVQPDMFLDGAFPGSGQNFSFGERPAPLRSTLSEEQQPLPGLGELPDQRAPARDINEGVQGGLDLTPKPGAEPEPEQPRLPFTAHQPSFGDKVPEGGFNQPSVPAIVAEHATPQKGLTLEEAKAQPAANRNLPPNDQPPAAQQNLDARLRDPQDPLFKAAAGLNDNAERPGLDRAPTVQPALPLTTPDGREPANPQVVQDKTTPAPEGPNTRLATQAPENTNDPNRPGPIQDATAQPDATAKPNDLTAANDKFDQTPIQADMNKIPELRGTTFKTQAEAETAVAKTITDREASGKAAPPALERIGKALGVIQDDGTIAPKFLAPEDQPEGPHETLEAGTQEPAAPAREDIPEQHQGRYDRIQAIRDRLGDNLSDPETFGLVQRARTLQNELQDVRGSTKTAEITRGIKALEGDVDTRERAAIRPDASDPRALASSTQATPDAQAFIAERQAPAATKQEQAKARKAGKVASEPPKAVATLPDNIPAVSHPDATPDPEAEKVPLLPTTAQDRAKAARAARAAPEAAPAPVAETPTTPQNFGQRMAAKKAQARLDAIASTEAQKRLKQETQTTQAAEAAIRKPTTKTPITSQIAGLVAQTRAALEALKTTSTRDARSAAGFVEALTKHDQQLAALEKAGQEGGLEALQNFRRDHFDDELWTKYLGRLTPEGEVALANHASAETDLMDTIAGLRGERPLIRYEVQPTVHDVNLANVIGATGKVGDALEYVRQNDPSPANRLMASTLARLGLDTEVHMAGDDQFLLDTTRKLGEGELVAASHNAGLNRINIYDGSNVSQSLLHEAIHAATERALASGSRAASDIRAIWEKLNGRTESKLYGLTNPSEMVAEAGSNPTFQQFLKSEPWQINGVKDVWTALKNGIFKMLGMPERVRSAFDQIMDGTQKLMAENPTAAAITGDRPLIVDRAAKALMKRADAFGNASISQMAREAEGKRTGLNKAARDGINGFTPSRDIAEMHAKNVPTMRDYVASVTHTNARKDTMYKTAAAAIHMTEGLSKSGIELINKVASRTFQDIDGSKSWAEHTHLHNLAKTPVLERIHAEAVKEYAALKRADGGKAFKALQGMQAEYASKYSARNVHMMFDHVKTLGIAAGTDGFKTDPFYDYEKNFRAHDNPALARDAFQSREAQMRDSLDGVRSKMLTDRDNLIAQQKADDQNVAAKNGNDLPKEIRQELDAKAKIAAGRYKDMNSLLQSIDDGNKAQARSPYAHLGRDGAHFVSADLAKDEHGIVKESAISALRDMLQAKGFKDVAVMQGTNSDGFYTRVGSETERELMTQELAKLQKAGHIDEKSITRGLATDHAVFNKITPDAMRQVVEAARANPPSIPEGATDAQKKAIEASHQEHVNELMRSMMELVPQSSLTRLYQYREGVQGFNSDMVANFRKAAGNNSNGLANLTMASEIGEKNKALKDQMKELNGNLALPGDQLTAATQAYNELMGRAQGVKTYSKTTMMDAVRNAGHMFSVGMSPVYVMTLLGQIATNSLAELGARHGYVEGAKALGRATGNTFKIVSAVARGQDASTFGMRYETLKKAGLGEGLIQDHLEMARRGVYAQGYTDSVAGHENGSTFAKYKHMANAMGRYAEMFPRVQLAEAAFDLYGKKPVAGFANKYDYAQHVINEAQFDWSANGNARQLTRAGMFGVMSPLINQFMGYQTRMSAKLYREVHGALGGDKMSQKWLLGHAAAVTALAGTLGLPMVSVAASVYDRLADWVTGKDDTDVIASYRTFLASTFGKEIGEVIARGAPRAVGVDFDHAGEGAIFPGSTTLMMLTEKRKLEDAERDWIKAEAGHAVGFMFNMASAARDLTNGDYMDALEKATPELLKGGVEAYRLNQRNFVDKNGQRLPINANTADIMMTAMGLDPAKDEEYREEAKTASGLNQMRQLRSQNITRHLLLAQSRGDGAMFQQWEQQGVQFQMDHPGMMGPLQTFGRQIAQHARMDAIARGTGTPVGVRPDDIITRGKTAFGNLRNSE